MQNNDLIHHIKNVRNALDALEQYLKTNDLPPMRTKTDLRRARTDDLREAIYAIIKTIPTHERRTLPDLHALMPTGSTRNLVGRCLRENGWEHKSVRVDGHVTRLWEYIA